MYCHEDERQENVRLVCHVLTFSIKLGFLARISPGVSVARSVLSTRDKSKDELASLEPECCVHCMCSALIMQGEKGFKRFYYQQRDTLEVLGCPSADEVRVRTEARHLLLVTS